MAGALDAREEVREIRPEGPAALRTRGFPPGCGGPQEGCEQRGAGAALGVERLWGHKGDAQEAGVQGGRMSPELGPELWTEGRWGREGWGSGGWGLGTSGLWGKERAVPNDWVDSEEPAQWPRPVKVQWAGL